MAISTFGGPVDILVVPDERASASAQHRTLPASNSTTATEANLGMEVIAADANVADSNGAPGAHPVARGTPSSSSLNLTVATRTPGRPDRTADYLYTDTSTSEVYGASKIWVPVSGESIYDESFGGPSAISEVAAATLPDGSIYSAAESWTFETIEVRKRTAGSPDWASVTTWSSSSLYTANVHPSVSMWTIPSNTGTGYIIYVGSFEVTAANTITLRTDYSTDAGATWNNANYSNLVLATNPNYYDRLRVVYDGVAKRLWLTVRKYDGAAYTLLTYFSDDYGANWSASDTIDDIRNAYMVNFGPRTLLATVDGTGILAIRHRSGADASWTSLDTDVFNGSYTVHADHLAMVRTDNGIYAVYCRLATNSSELIMAMSADGGKTWGNVAGGFPYTNGSYTTVLSDQPTGGLTEGLKLQAAVFQAGSVYLMGNFVSAGNTAQTIFAIVCGDIANLQWDDANAHVDFDTYYPVALPRTKSTQFAAFTGGSTHQILAIGGGVLVEDIANTVATGYNTYLDVGTVYNTRSARLILDDSSSGGSTAASDMVLRVTIDDNAGNNVSAEIRIDMTTRKARLYDVLGAGNLGNETSAWTASTPVEFYIDVDGVGQKVSAWYRLMGNATYTAIATNQALTPNAAAAVREIYYGKLNATNAHMRIRFFRPHVSEGFADGFAAADRKGIPAATIPSRIPAGVHISWRGAPLMPGNSWTARAWSRTSIAFTSPLSVDPSPLRQWVGTVGAAGATYRIVYDFGASYDSTLSDNMIGVMWANAPGVYLCKLQRWTGAAWSDEISGDARESYGAGAVSISRSSVTSYKFRPGPTPNARPKVWAQDYYRGWWAVLSDGGGNTIAGTVLRNDPGQFTSSSPATLPAALELDPSTVVATFGTFAGFSLSTNAGTLYLYSPDGIAVSTQSTASTRYYAIEVTLAPGATLPKAGLLTFGPAYAFARPARDGSSIRWVADQRLAQPVAIVELPFDQQLVHNGTYNLIGSAVQNVLSFNGTTPRALIDSNIETIVAALRQAGPQFGRRGGLPVGMVVNGDWQADPGSSDQSFVGRDVVFGYVQPSVDVTAGVGHLYQRDNGNSQLGTSFVLNGPALYLGGA